MRALSEAPVLAVGGGAVLTVRGGTGVLTGGSVIVVGLVVVGPAVVGLVVVGLVVVVGVEGGAGVATAVTVPPVGAGADAVVLAMAAVPAGRAMATARPAARATA